MEHLEHLLNSLIAFVPVLSVFVVWGCVMRAIHWFLLERHAELSSERKFPRQLTVLGLLLLGLVLCILVLPVSDSVRDRLVSLVGLVISAVIALSSTTIVANLMAGMLLRITKPFKTGDFVRVGDYFGRITERGLLDTELQTESRELIALPNTFLITHPVTTVLNSGTIVSVSLSLGFDVHHSQIESLLLAAAEKSQLQEPFVHILEIGNYAITYRISGLLLEAKGLITARSTLFRNVLDVLHGSNIEIMSPTYMNQRPIPADQKVIPSSVVNATSGLSVAAEEVVFDKADRAEEIENEKQKLTQDLQEKELLLKAAAGESRDQLKLAITALQERLRAIENQQDELNEEDNTEK